MGGEEGRKVTGGGEKEGRGDEGRKGGWWRNGKKVTEGRGG